MLVVPGVDPVSDVLSGLGSGDIPSVVDPFLLEGGEKRLGGGVVQSGAYLPMDWTIPSRAQALVNASALY